MASADLRDELHCSICLSLYTDPVSLRCGHNFCRSCIVSALDAQEAAGVYSCAYCREESPQRPALEKNRKLANIVERFLSSPPDMESRIFCTYCIKSPVPAVRTCLHCENSLCDDHLAAHNQTVDHILIDPTSSFGNKKCSVHKKVLEYYCLQDAACLCVTCCLVGKHRGHQVELLEKAFEKRENIRKLFMDMKEQLEMAEKKVQSEIFRQEDEIVSQISHLIKELEKEEKELSGKMHHMEQMCHITDPIRLLQERDIAKEAPVHGDTKKEKEEEKLRKELDEDLISLTVHRSMRDIVTSVTSGLGFQVPDVLLDEDTAHIEVELSDDLKTATYSEEEQHRPKSPRRFLSYPQVLSRCGLSSGRHYWEVAWNEVGVCYIGVSYPSIERGKKQSLFGENDKSWSSCPTFGVFLDYEAGRLSFYELCDPIRHLHTFTASFTEPLHVAFYVYDEASVTITS
ncbi:hypothetical protein GDO78_021493 [Eleutherodactylus coqui]|uniref:Uncharacterized protein n=1 Tax=Eleutherodactylus coqui TaxID=57060 RepID=A0A8J6BEL7_ELECQ|nr:hypothetical protein GDO78_021493 [Eleutherodactylus coqui]